MSLAHTLIDHIAVQDSLLQNNPRIDVVLSTIA